jgi:hypothetical protein
MATTTTNFGWDIPQSTDLVKDGATAIAALGQDIDTAMVDLKGGTTGQVLAKASGTDLDFSWVAVDPLTILDAKGDLITATAADTPARLAVGTNGQILTADSTAATGLKWATAGSGGKVLQVVSATSTTAVSIATTTLTDTGITATITPTASNSKIMVIISTQARLTRSNSFAYAGARLFRGATQIQDWGSYGFAGVAAYSARCDVSVNHSVTYLDSPATTSATTYKLQGRCETATNSETIDFQYAGSPSTITLLEIGA